MVTAVLNGPVSSREYKDLEMPFRSIALRMEFGARELSDTKVAFDSLECAKMWLWRIFKSFSLEELGMDSYIIDGATFFRHGDACIDIEQY